MNLVSENFILFMIVTTIMYYLSPKKIKKYTLLIISIITLTCLGLENVLYILFSVLITYFAGLGIEKGKYKKLILFGAVLINSLILIIMKIFPYLSELEILAQFNILVPLRNILLYISSYVLHYRCI